MMSVTQVNADHEKFKILNDIETKCTAACRQPNCDDTYYVPVPLGTEPGDQISFSVEVSDRPNLQTEYRPRVEFISFIVDFLGTFVFWLGQNMLNTFDFIWDHTIGSMHEKQVASRQERLKRKEERIMSHLPPRDYFHLEKDVSKLEMKVRHITDFLYGAKLGKRMGLLGDKFAQIDGRYKTYSSPTADRRRHSSRL